MRFFIFMGALLLAIGVFAQTTVTVKDSANQPLPGANVSYQNSGMITNANGVVQLPNLKKGTRITVSFIGFHSQSKIYAGKNMVFVLEEEQILLEELVVSALRAKKHTPIAFSNVSKKDIENKNLGQDIPFLLNSLPSVVTTSDAGAGVGYTGIRVRGSDATRVNVTINGVPLNDSESQGVWWVNMPDFASSISSMQLQRGVGTSTNGAGAFGASLNLLTDKKTPQAFGEISNSFGSFNTLKHTLKLGTGTLGEHFEVSGRLSKITSDGYIDRASSDLKSYFFQGTYFDDNTIIKALVFGGKEKTYQAWNGIGKEQLENDRRYNPAGEYTDANGKTKYYDNETDNYQQDHYQLHWNEQITPQLSTHLGIHYTKGEGYYENYKTDRYSEYGLAALPKNAEGKESKAGIIRRKWLDNDFYGAVFSLNYQGNDLNFTVGGGLNKYKGNHFGTILWTEKPATFDYKGKYYDSESEKLDGNIYAKANYKFDEEWQVFADLQYRYVNYKMEVKPIDESLNFFNPKAGITYSFAPHNQMYFSYARGHREPNRNDYKDNEEKVEPEQLDDFELGWRYKKENLNVNANLYYMLYKNQLVLTGALNDVGAFIRDNVGKSYRLGLELDANWQITPKWTVHPNVAISSNKNIDFLQKDGDEVKNLGNTNISFSPNLIAGNSLVFSPKKNIQIALLSKYVGEQYMVNNDVEAAKLDAYFVNDLSFSWQIKTTRIFKSVDLNVMINNIFNKKYVSNGWYGWGYVGYYPQAEANFLAGVTLKF